MKFSVTEMIERNFEKTLNFFAFSIIIIKVLAYKKILTYVNDRFVIWSRRHQHPSTQYSASNLSSFLKFPISSSSHCHHKNLSFLKC